MILSIDFDEIDSKIFVIENTTNSIINVNKKASKFFEPVLYIGNNVSSILGDNINYNNLTQTDTYIKINNKNTHVCLIKKNITNMFSILIVIVKRVEYNSKFMANFSHEVRTPLNAIMGITSLVSDTSLTEEQSNYIDMLKEAGYNLLRIVNDILDYSRLEEGKMMLINKVFYLKNCIETAHDIVLFKSTEKNIDMQYHIEQDIPDFVIGDIQRLRQILINLYYNAIKFTEENGKVITLVSLEKLNKEDKTIILKFKITDTGVGISTKDHTKLFTSYSQLYNDFTEVSKEGTGLGLAICKELTELMGGTIWLEYSEPNKGSIFSFTVKLKECLDNTQYSIADKDLSILKNKRALIIDDNSINRMTICDQLIKWDMDPIPCSTTDEALLLLKKKKEFDIIMLDIRLPKESGITLGKKIKKMSPKIPLIALSSIGENVMSSHFDIFEQFLIKPIKEHKLLSACLSVLQSKKDQLLIKDSIQEKLSNELDSIKILIDEDMYLNQIVLKTLLIKLGYTNITIVNNGLEAISALEKEKFDVCLIDIKTPFISGYDVLKKIKTMENIPYCVALTALVAKGDQYIEFGFDDYLFKPIELNTVNTMMSKYINKKFKL